MITFWIKITSIPWAFPLGWLNQAYDVIKKVGRCTDTEQDLYIRNKLKLFSLFIPFDALITILCISLHSVVIAVAAMVMI